MSKNQQKSPHLKDNIEVIHSSKEMSGFYAKIIEKVEKTDFLIYGY